MKQFLRFRVSSHSLPIEAGRRTRPQVPRSTRLCPHCTSQLVMKDTLFLSAHIYNQFGPNTPLCFASPFNQ